MSTPQEPGREVIAGLAELGSRFGIQPQDIGYFTHGTTVGINSVIQRKGIRLCLFTTENFVDVLELARLKMPDPYHLMSRRAEPLVTRDRVLPVRERILADGTVDRPLDPASLRRALDQAIALGAEGIVLALLHSYRNPAHEREAQRLIGQWAPRCRCSARATCGRSFANTSAPPRPRSTATCNRSWRATWRPCRRP